jgi:hypothetical protein
MHGPINVKSPNNTSKWQMGFNSAFKGLNPITGVCPQRMDPILFSGLRPTSYRRNTKPPSSMWKTDVPRKCWYPTTARNMRSNNSNHHGMDLYRQNFYFCVAYLMALSVTQVIQHRMKERSVKDVGRSGRGSIWGICQKGSKKAYGNISQLRFNPVTYRMQVWICVHVSSWLH